MSKPEDKGRMARTYTEKRVCETASCGIAFTAKASTPQKHCAKCRKAHDVCVYTPRYNGMHSRIENPDADD